MVRRTVDRTYSFQDQAQASRNRKVGRPQTAEGPSHHVTLSVTKLRRWLHLIQRMNEQPRAAKNRHALRELATEIAERLGPAADPAWSLETRERPAKLERYYRVTTPEGLAKNFASLEALATWWGAKPSSLRSRLAKGGAYHIYRKMKLANPNTGNVETQEWLVQRLAVPAGTRIRTEDWHRPTDTEIP